MNRPQPGELSSKQLFAAERGRAFRIGLLLILLCLPFLVFAQPTASANGYLLLQSNLPGVRYQINGREYSEVQYLPLPPGSYEVRAFAANPVTGTFEQTRLLEVGPGETTDERFDFDHGNLSLSSNESYARFAIAGVPLEKVIELPLPPGTYTVSATLPRAVTGFGDYQISRSVTLEAGQHLNLPLDFSYGSATIRSSLEDTKYLIDGVAKNRVNKLKLPLGEHRYTAFPPAPYDSQSGSFVISSGEELVLELEFAKTPLISDAEKRREFAWRFGLMPAAVLEANHYFNLDGAGPAGYHPLSNGLSVSGLRF